MGLLDSVVGMLTGGQGGGQAGLLQAVISMLGNHPQGSGGGLTDILGKLTQGGLGDAVGSWIGSGPNQSVSADQITNALGKSQLDGLAEKLGMSHGDVAGGLSQILPQLVDHLTPDGRMPDASAMGSLGDLLSKFQLR